MIKEINLFPNYEFCSSGKVYKKGSSDEVNYRKDKYGKISVDIWSFEGKRKHITLHKVIAMAFLPNPNEYKHVIHIDDDYSNNDMTNLRWCYSGDFKKKAKLVVKDLDAIEVKGFDNYCINPNGIVYGKNGKILKQRKSEGYRNVVLYINGIKHVKSVHRLVAENFIKKPLHKSIVNHKDGNRSNNCVDNLEWCTQSENVIHAFDVLGRKAARGQQLKCSKLVLNLETGIYYESIKEYWGILKTRDKYEVFWRKVKNNKIHSILIV
jgi:hypothetical protein